MVCAIVVVVVVVVSCIAVVDTGDVSGITVVDTCKLVDVSQFVGIVEVPSS